MILVNGHKYAIPTVDITSLSGGTATQSHAFTGEEGSKAVDNLLTTKWTTNNSVDPSVGAPVWWQWDAGVGNTRTPTRFGFITRRNTETSGTTEQNREMRDFEVWGSSDSTMATKTVLLTVTGNSWSTDSMKYWDFTTTGAFRYFRVNITANNTGGGEDYVQVAELELLQF